MPDTKLGFRIRTKVQRLPKELVEEYKNFSTPNVADAMGRMGVMHHSVKPRVPITGTVVGSAVTVEGRAGDNLMLCKAVDLCEPGDIVVVSSPGGEDMALWGGVLSTLAKARGIAAFVTDGFARDVAELRRVGLPVWAAGIIATGPSFDGRGEINFPISCGGVIVNPGDIVVCDEDAVVIVPAHLAAEIAPKAWKVVERDRKWMELSVKDPRFAAIKDVDAVLKEKGVQYVEE
jgi:regulator of RNase E activity RraA